MNYRLQDVIGSLDYNEIVNMKEDLASGGFHLINILEDEISEREEKHKTDCTTCSSPLNPNSLNNFTLLFGPHDFRKKASFCGTDCLEYFLNELRLLKQVTD